MISLHQLRTFLAVASTGSVWQAAERLVVSQPAVSSALGTLQRDLGMILVERSGRGIAVTPAGREVERGGRRLFALLDDMQRQALAAASARTGYVRLAVVTTAVEQLLPPLLTGFRQRYPEIEVEIEVANRARVWERLENWEVDLAIAGRAPADRGFDTLATHANELVVVGATPGAGDPATLGAATWLLRETGSGTRDATEEFFAQLGISPPRLTIGSNEAILGCVRSHLGVSLLSRNTIERDLKAGALALIDAPGTPIARAWHLVCSADRERSNAARLFVEYAIEGSEFQVP